jgi:hypothetical protein
LPTQSWTGSRLYSISPYSVLAAFGLRAFGHGVAFTMTGRYDDGERRPMAAAGPLTALPLSEANYRYHFVILIRS